MDNLPDDMCRKCVGYGKLDSLLYNKRSRLVGDGKEVECPDCAGTGKRPTACAAANQYPMQHQN